MAVAGDVVRCGSVRVPATPAIAADARLRGVPFFDVDDLHLYYEVHGEGPPLLMITGSGNDLRLSSPATHPLNRNFETLFYDQRGLGQTSIGPPNPTMADFADDAARVIGAHGWESCHVMGSSFGGMVALHLALRHPEVIDRLVLCCTSPGGAMASYPLHDLAELTEAERDARRLELNDQRAADDDEVAAWVRRYMAFGENPPETTAGVAGSVQQMKARRTHDVLADLGSIAAPTLVCAGRYDGIAPLANSERLAADIPNATLEVFEGGHPFVLQDRRALARIRDFLLD